MNSEAETTKCSFEIVNDVRDGVQPASNAVRGIIASTWRRAS